MAWRKKKGSWIMAIKPLNVSQLNKYIGRILSTDPILGNVLVKGEITNIKYHGSGHVFFTLKDENSKVSCFMPADYVEELRYELTDGMEVTASGRISVYERGGYYSLTVRNVEVSGAGELALAFKALYEKLKKEGLFDMEHKKPLPAFPRRVCVITSETGAAVRDILKIIRSRNDVTDVMVYPCLVQGDAAGRDIAAAIDDVNSRFAGDVDVIIVGRGGGAAEELWAFNEEIVARSIYASEIPVISAVGHEIDYSISDYVADFRAETPTAAAAMAVPDTFALREQLQRESELLGAGIRRKLERCEDMMERYSRGMMHAAFRNRIGMWAERCENLGRRMQEGMPARIRRLGEDAGRLEAQMDMDMRRRVAACEAAARSAAAVLEAAAPSKILARGYAIVRDEETGKVLTSAADAASPVKINLEMKDGHLVLRNESAIGQP